MRTITAMFDTRAEDTAIAGNAVIARVNVATGEMAEIHREPHPQPWGPGVGAPWSFRALASRR